MLKKQLRKIISLIIITAFVGRLVSPLAVLAQSTPPPPPEAPQAPGGPPSAPSAPSGPGSPPSAPSAPSGPSAPSYSPSAPSGPSGPPPPPVYTYVPPTSAPAPTGEVFPTGEALPTGEVLPTGSELSSIDPTTTPGTEGNSSSGYSSGSVNDPYNLATGPYSYNYGQEIINKSIEEVNKNLAEMQNKIDAMTSTGFNYADLNTLDGEIFTGDVISTVNLMNKLNSNMSGLGTFSTFNLYGSYLGDIALQFTDGSPLSAFVQASETVAKNSITGPMSQNYSISDGNFTVKEANGNDAKLTNDINLGADTGSNSASLNTGNGIIQTGNATALGNIINMVNSNINVSKWLFAVLNIFGELAGNIILPREENASLSTNTGGSTMVGNENTGPMSTNYASATTNNTAEFTNVNNADIVSTLNVDANTGNNTASMNTGGGYVSTGMADAAISNSTVANSNTVDEEGTVWLVIVNEMGKWVGHIVGNPYGVNTASNSLPVTTETGGLGEQSFGVYSENKTTGPGSTNVSQIETSEESIVTNENNAAINNNINASANTGNNQAMTNTGAGVIETGDADVGLSLLNMANTNVTAKKFVVVFVNVLGSFLGDIIPTGEWDEASTNNYYQAAENNQVSVNLPVLPTLPPLPTLMPINDYILPIGDIEENSANNYYYYPEYYPDQIGGNSYYYPPEYRQAAAKVTRERNKLTLLKKQYAAISQAPEQEVIGQTRLLRRGTSVSTSFIKATESSNLLIGGIKLKVTNSWLVIIPFTLFIFYWRRRRRYNIDFTVYLNNILEVIL